jgi:hypothetical protein
MKPLAAAVAGSLISGMSMYAVGARGAQKDSRLVQPSTFVQTAERHLDTASPTVQPRARLVRTSAPVQTVPRVAPSRTVYQSIEPASVDERDDARSERSWTKTALIIGGSTASGAGVGGIMGGKKGALIGAAIGGGAASIYEASRRH